MLYRVSNGSAFDPICRTYETADGHRAVAYQFARDTGWAPRHIWEWGMDTFTWNTVWRDGARSPEPQAAANG